MPSSGSRAVLAVAGAGKTTRLVKEVLAHPDRRYLIVTYTSKNLEEIRQRFLMLNSGVPKNASLMSWYRFLLHECARPYQRASYQSGLIRGIFFSNTGSAQGVRETRTAHYLTREGDLFSDKVSKFVVKCDGLTGGAVGRRLSEIYTDILIDEFQDLVGYDLEVVRMLMDAGVRVVLAGDPRQHTYATNPSSKHSRYAGAGVKKLFEEWEAEGICRIDRMNESWRCAEEICNLASAVWPELSPLVSRAPSRDSHSGVFAVASSDVPAYLNRYRPQVLRYDVRAEVFGEPALNFGASKGQEFPRVLIVPTGPIRTFLPNLDPSSLQPKSRSGLYVAVTRAKHSVGVVWDREVPRSLTKWVGP